MYWSTKSRALLVAAGAILGCTVGAIAGEVNLSRLVITAVQADKGIVQALDHTLVQSLCRDEDGYEFIIQMIDQQAANPGKVHSRAWRLFQR